MNYPVVSATKGRPERSSNPVDPVSCQTSREALSKQPVLLSRQKARKALSNPVHPVIPANIRRISLNPAHPVILSNTRVEQLIAWANPPSTAACVVLSSPDVARGFDWKHRFRRM